MFTLQIKNYKEVKKKKKDSYLSGGKKKRKSKKHTFSKNIPERLERTKMYGNGERV